MSTVRKAAVGRLRHSQSKSKSEEWSLSPHKCDSCGTLYSFVVHTTRDLQQGRGTLTSLDGRQGRFTNQALTELFSASAIASLKYRTFYRRVLSGLVRTVQRPTVGTSDDPESLVAWFTETAGPKESMSVDEYLRYLEQHV